LGRILITGANGFVGRHVLGALAQAGYPLTLAHRRGRAPAGAAGHRLVEIDGIGPTTDWSTALDDCETILHLAGQVPRRGIDAGELHEVNAAGTGRLVEQARAAGVRRFVLLSSVATVVDERAAGVIDEKMPPAPVLSAYGASKAEAERHVAAFARDGRTGIAIRPPLVYGAEAKGTWAALQRMAASGLPLPFASIDNRRSMIAVDNLAVALLAAVSVSRVRDVSGAYFVADSGTASVRDIFTWLRQGMGISPRLVPVPPSLLRGAFTLVGLGRPVARLLGDLAIDSGLFRRTFDWTPPLDTEQGVKRSGAAYVAARL